MQKYDWDITENDLSRAREFEETEKITSLTSEKMFPGIIYCLLSSRNNYDMQMRLMRRLKILNALKPEGVKKCPGAVMEKTGKQYGPLIIKLAEYFPTSGLEELMVNDLRNGHVQEHDIRKKLAKECPGLKEKCASLFMRMCGYRRCVPIDRWALRFLRDMGNEKARRALIKYDESGRRGVSGKPYIELEAELIKHAETRGIHPADFQLAIYFKRSLYQPGKQQPIFKEDKFW